MSGPRFAVLGGSGQFGLGLASRLALGGARVVVGSRDRNRAEAAARRIRNTPEAPARDIPVSGAMNAAAAAAGDVVFLSVPFAAQAALLEEVGPALEDRLVVCCAVIWPPGSRPGTSAAEEAERVLRRLGLERVRVAAAFQTVAAGSLRAPPTADRAESPDVLVFADADDDRAAAARAAGFTGLRAVPVGPLRQSRGAEAALGMLLELNRSSGRHAGFRVTGFAG